MSSIALVSIIIMIIGIVGMIYPLFPGTLVVFLGPLIYVVSEGFSRVSVFSFILMIILTVLGMFIDNIGSFLGVKKFGASKKGLMGALIGGLIGLFLLNIPGFLIGQFLGVIVTELHYGKQLKESFKAGFGVFIGYIAGYLMKIVLGGTILIIFAASVLW